MKTNVTKRLACAFLALAVMITTVFVQVEPAQAATNAKTVYVSSDWEQASPYTEVKVPFTLTSNAGMDTYILVNTAANAKIALYDSTGNKLVDYDNNPLNIYTTDWVEYSGAYAYYDEWKGSLPAGDYYYSMTFDRDVYYLLQIDQKAANAKISQNKATITKGFTKKLSVSGAKVKSWKSKNTKIAKVDKNGKVTGVKAGKTTIYATTTDGKKLACKVTVKENKYSVTKPTLSDVKYGKRVLCAYKAKFDSKGNLVITGVFANNSSYRVSYLKNVKIKVKDANGKTIGVYNAKKINSGTAAYSTKNMTFTIKKSSLKKKKADLRNATISTSGVAVYYY